MTPDAIRSHFNERETIHSIMDAARKALAAHLPDRRGYSPRTMREGQIDEIELSDDGKTISARSSNWTCGGLDTEHFAVPVDIASICGNDPAKWNVWAEEEGVRMRAELEQRAQQERELQAAEKRQRDLAELARLQAQYPDAA